MTHESVHLKDLVILWSPLNRNMSNAGQMEVTKIGSDLCHKNDYLFSVGAVFSDWRSLPDDNARYAQLLAELITILGRDRVPFSVAHKALLKCPEYVAILSCDFPEVVQ